MLIEQASVGHVVAIDRQWDSFLHDAAMSDDRETKFWTITIIRSHTYSQL
jgi:hypothetical protein